MHIKVIIVALMITAPAGLLAHQDEDLGVRLERQRQAREIESDKEKIKMFEGICKLRRADLKAGRKPTGYFEILSLIGREQPGDVGLLKETCKSF